MVTRIRKPRPVFDYAAGCVAWELEPPPHGVNHAKELARWAPTPHIYKRDESRLWEVYVKGVTGGWVPPAKKPISVDMTFWLPEDKLLSLDVDKWAPIVVDAVVGSRYDQWVFECRSRKRRIVPGLVVTEPFVLVLITWQV